jgi:hypothetical protein
MNGGPRLCRFAGCGHPIPDDRPFPLCACCVGALNLAITHTTITVTDLYAVLAIARALEARN